MEKLQCKKLSEVDKNFSGFISGFVFNSSERKKIVTKSGNYYKGITSLNILTIISQKVCTESSVSKFAEQMLLKKYKKEIYLYHEIPIKKLIAVWNNKIAASTIKGLFVASILREESDSALIEKICNRINLFISNELAIKEKNVKFILNLEDNIKIIENKNSIIRTKYRDVKKEKNQLFLENESLRKEILYLKSERKKEKKIVVIQPTETPIHNETEFLQKKIELLKNRLAEKTELINSLRERNQLIENFVLPKMQECETCERKNLCSRRILMVGGLNKFKGNYKNSVESLNGEFKYHDGKKTGNINLKESINWADTVLFSTDINSHYACLETKKLCKKMNKNYFVLKNSGIVAFSKTIEKICQF